MEKQTIHKVIQTSVPQIDEKRSVFYSLRQGMRQHDVHDFYWPRKGKHRVGKDVGRAIPFPEASPCQLGAQ